MLRKNLGVSRRKFVTSVLGLGGVAAVTLATSRSRAQELLFERSSDLGGFAQNSLSETTQLAADQKLNVLISDNHGHRFVITMSELLQNGPRTYSIRGGSNHDHEVLVTAEVLQEISSKGVVELVSSNVGGHIHQVKIQITA